MREVKPSIKTPSANSVHLCNIFFYFFVISFICIFQNAHASFKHELTSTLLNLKMFKRCSLISVYFVIFFLCEFASESSYLSYFGIGPVSSLFTFCL